MADANPNLANAATVAKSISDLLTSQNVRELGHYIAQIAENANNQFFYLQHISNTVPHGATLRFVLGRVDDEATVRCEGLVMSARRGDATSQQLVRLGTPGPNVILAELGNSGGYDTAISLDVAVQGVTNPGPLITMRFKDNDPPGTQHKRNFIFKFNVV